MQAGMAYMERHSQVAGMVYRNICAEYGLKVLKSKWGTPPKVVDNDKAKIPWDFQIQTDKQAMADQPDNCGGLQTAEGGSSKRWSDSKWRQHQELKEEVVKIGTRRQQWYHLESEHSGP